MSEAPAGDPEPPAPPPPRIALLQASRVAKAYGHVQALAGVDLELYPGEILGLVGDNGAGKSTMIKILSGAVQPDRGEIRIDGRSVQLRNPVTARTLGIETVYQELAVVPMMDIAENLFLGREQRQGMLLGRLLRLIDKRTMRRRAAEHLRSLQIGVRSVRQRVETLSGGQRQGVAVARAVAFGRRIVILDEPTAALGVRESRGVLELIRLINQRGISVILISHDMPQVLEITHRIIVLRHGRRVGTVHTRETDIEQIVRLITGAEDLS
jgi:fructose transport system ATP-binding protein